MLNITIDESLRGARGFIIKVIKNGTSNEYFTFNKTDDNQYTWNSVNLIYGKQPWFKSDRI